MMTTPALWWYMSTLPRLLQPKTFTKSHRLPRQIILLLDHQPQWQLQLHCSQALLPLRLELTNRSLDGLPWEILTTVQPSLQLSLEDSNQPRVLPQCQASCEAQCRCNQPFSGINLLLEHCVLEFFELGGWKQLVPHSPLTSFPRAAPPL